MNASNDKSKPDITPIFEWLDMLEKKCFYGSIEISFQHGNVVNIAKHETLKLRDLKK